MLTNRLWRELICWASVYPNIAHNVKRDHNGVSRSILNLIPFDRRKRIPMSFFKSNSGETNASSPLLCI